VKILDKIKAHKGKITAGVVGAVVSTSVLDFNPTFVSNVVMAKKSLSGTLNKTFPDKPKLPTPEDLTASEHVGISVYIDGERRRLVVSIDQRDKLLGISDDLAYIKRENNGQQIDILLMLDCQKRFGETELYDRCIDLVFEDFSGDNNEVN